MNLIQVADRLKELPNSPQTMQALTAYANGASPIVPPYLALTELQRRTKLAQQAAAAQPPAGTVKDQIEQQASGISALAQQGQAMAQAQMQPPPQATPQPQQAPQQPVQAASGGLMSLLARAQQARRMNSGGIIAFRKAGSVGDPAEYDEDAEADTVRAAIDADAEGGGDDDDEDTGGMQNVPKDARGAMALLNAMALKRQAAGAPKYVSPLEAEEELKKKYPERFAALDEPTGVAALKRLDELQAAQREELAKRREEAAAAKPSVAQMLGRAALRSRGQYGKSALASILGGYEELQSGAEAKALEQEQGLRMRELELQQVRAEALNKIDEIKRARAEGDLKREMQAKSDFAKLLKDHNVSINTLLGKQITAAGSLAGAERRAEATEEAGKKRAEAIRYAADKPKAPTTAQLRAADVALIAKNIRRKNPEIHPDDAREQATRIVAAMNQQAQFAGVAQRTRADAEKAVGRASMFNDPTWKQYVKEASGDEAAAKEAYLADYQRGVLPEPASGPVGGAPAAGKPAPAPATQFKVGETRVVQQGPDKGKTVEWDGTGWKLK